MMLKPSSPNFIPEFVCEKLSFDQLGGRLAQLQLLARTYHCMLKLARTIAGQAGSEAIQPQHLAEARQYRPKVNTTY